MTAPANHWKLGLFVVIGSLLAMTSVVYFGTRSLRKEHVTYHSYFDEAVTGLEVGSTVRFRGVTIGNVSHIDVAPDRRHVEVDYELAVTTLGQLGLAAGAGRGTHTKISVPPDLRAQLGSTGLTGVKYILIDFFDVKANPPPVVSFKLPENYIPAAASTMKNLEDSVVRAVDNFPKLAEQMLSVMQRVDHVLTTLDEKNLPEHLAATLGHADQALDAIRIKIQDADVAGISSEARGAVANLNNSMAALHSVLLRFDGDKGVVASMQRASDSFGDVAGSARDLGPELSDTMREIRDAVDSIRELADTLDRDSDMLVKGRARVSTKEHH